MKKVISSYLKLHAKLLWVLWVGFWKKLLSLWKKQEGVMQEHKGMLSIKCKGLDHPTSQGFQYGTSFSFFIIHSSPSHQLSLTLHDSLPLCTLPSQEKKKKKNLFSRCNCENDSPFLGEGGYWAYNNTHSLWFQIPLVNHQGYFPKQREFPP